MIFAVESAAKVAKADLETAMKDVAGKMAAFSEKAAASHANSALERKALADSIAANAKEVSTMLKDSVATAARAMTSLEQETSKKIADTNTQLDAYAKQMEEQAEKTRAAIKALTTKTEGEIKAESERAAAATAEFTKADEARQADARKFLEEQMAAAAKESEEKFGKAIATMAKDRADADLALGSAFNQLNDDLAKQAALSDSRFKNTVKDIDAAKAEATAAVTQLRKDFGTRLIEVNSLVKNIESRLSSNIAKVSGEVAEEKALQARVNERTVAELD